MINEVFPAATAEQWKQKAEETLKGKPVETLGKSTYEDIRLKPLYSKEDLENQIVSQFPGYQDYRRGINPLGYVTSDWKVAQTITATNPDELKELLLSSFQKGQTAISFEVSEKLISEISSILADIVTSYPFNVNAKEFQAELLKAVQSLAEKSDGRQELSGYIGMDPIAIAVESGSEVEGVYEQWANTIRDTTESFPNLKTILVDTTPYHNGGANAVQELAIALATGVEHISKLTEQGLSLETVLDKMVFKFAIGSNFFMEMAKLRAARLLWSKLTESYGATPELRKMVISAETSKFTKTKYDPYVNLLRAGNEAFSAILGGIQYLHVSPFNEPEGQATAFSDRIARNTQLIIKEEAHLKKVVDPAGGSWYIESLTNEVAQKAWDLFLEIDAKGGIISTLRSNWLQEQIAAVKEKRQKDIFTRKQSIIGTNIYANLQDQPLQVAETKMSSNAEFAIKPIAQERLAQGYEELRSRAEQLTEQTGKGPAVGLIALGALKQHKARADFITGFVAPGGIQTVKSEEINSFEDAVAFVENTPLKHYCICGGNDQYNEIVLELVTKLNKQYPNVQLYLAGIPENQSDFSDAGVTDCITLKSNCYETLSKLLDEMEVESK
ncbi:methylmalonyl-CoA mutase subunit beta [Bacillus sp. 1NLA3E]|uniref:methylmalonyl-CoA mutase subunit beta n=1 Tax=Bacillus sp. 1NLA3E TaxID=666686 RepID=UPI000247E352|nr:methylmalonyl-CoA mutase subunit beta [Bacillus sp. 1NLA3E]